MTVNMTMRVLVVEDDPAIRGFLVRGLSEEGFAVDSAEDGLEASCKAHDPAYDFVILDLSIPGKDGLVVLRECRAARIGTPMLILTARDAVADRIAGLDAGADDYLVKPFVFDELLARMRAVMRRRLPSERIVKVGDLVIDRPARLIKLRDTRIDFSSREYAILEILALHPGQVVTRTRIFEQVWNEQFEPASNTIDVHVKQIRRKLALVDGGDLIETVRGAGYRLRDAASP